MGRSPSCERVSLKKGPWTPEEDQKLLANIEQHGHGSWRAVPAKAGLRRCGKSCRLRWINYLRPDIKRGKFSLQEEQTIIQLHALLGNRWSVIATHLSKRTDNEIKNYWNTHIKKRLTRMGIDPVTHRRKTNALGSAIVHSKDASNLSHMAQWESARLEAEARLFRESKLVSNPTYDHQLGERPASSAQLTRTSTCENQILPPLNQYSDYITAGKASRAALVARPQCLDVLKAWQRVVSGMFGVARDNLESPTSTLNLNVGNSIPCSEKSGQVIGGPMRLHEIPYNTDVDAAGVAWFQDFFRAHENVMEGLSDMIICTDSGYQQINSSSINAESSDGNFGGNFDQENENYWNSVMNLVNASTTWSPLF